MLCREVRRHLINTMNNLSNNIFRRDQTMTALLSGVVVVLVVCHTPKTVINIYECYQVSNVWKIFFQGGRYWSLLPFHFVNIKKNRIYYWFLGSVCLVCTQWITLSWEKATGCPKCTVGPFFNSLIPVWYWLYSQTGWKSH